MDKKNRRYDIQSKVRVPNMDDIQRAASDFSDVHEEQKNDFVARNTKNIIPTDDKDKYVPQLNEIKKEMVQLAMAVASSESEKSSTVILPVTSDEVNADSDEQVLSSTEITEDLKKAGNSKSSKNKDK